MLKNKIISKCLFDLLLAILWVIILVLNILSGAHIVVIILDGICVFCWLLSASIEFYKYKKEKNNEN